MSNDNDYIKMSRKKSNDEMSNSKMSNNEMSDIKND